MNPRRRWVRREKASLHAAEGRFDELLARRLTRLIAAYNRLDITAMLPSFGEFQALREIGRGGMGVVYLAEDRRDGSQVALKAVRVTDARLVGSIRREILTLSRLSHPGIVRILAHGIDEGMPWYAMTFERGVTLRARMTVVDPVHGDETRAPENGGLTMRTGEHATGRTMPVALLDAGATDPMPPRGGVDVGFALDVLRDLCSPLAYLHGEGLVHRDLKPENVVIRPDGSPVIVDFGLATEFGAEREDVDAASDPSGTALYMAPEQWDGSLVDARTDIYALGCIAYELLTGRPPFYGTGLLELHQKHKTAAPTSPTHLVASIPPEIDRLVLSMLAKRPKDRTGHLEDVARVLDRHGARSRATEAPPRSRAYLYRAELAGRTGVLGEIQERLRQIAEPGGSGAALRLRGESGVGKTRLALAAIEEARRRRIPSLTGRGDPKGALLLEPFRALLTAVTDRCRERGVTETTRLLDEGGRRAFTLAPFAPDLVLLPGVDRAAAPPALPPDAARQRLFVDLADLIEALADRRALLFVLDDLQWADELSIAALAFLQRSGRLARMPVLVLATERAEEVTPAIEEIFGIAGTATIAVGRLDAEAVGAVVSDMLADPAPSAELVGALHGSSEGNPFFVAEYLRSLVLEGRLARSAEGRWQAPMGASAALETLALPRALGDLISARLDALPDRARRVLDAAAVLGRDVEVDLLSALVGVAGHELSEPLWNLSRRHLVDEVSPGYLRFDHDKIREVAIARLDAAAKKELHGRAAAALDVLRPGDPDVQAILADHLREAGEDARALGCFLAAARIAADRAALGAAEEHYGAALALAGDVPSKDGVAARLDLSSYVLSPLGRTAEALAVSERAHADARAIGDRGRIAASLMQMATNLRVLGRTGDAERAAAEALDIQRELGDRRGEQRALRYLSEIAMQRGDLASAESHERAALTILEALGDRTETCKTLIYLAGILGARGTSSGARDITERAIALARETGDRHLLAFAWNGVFIDAFYRGALDEALAAASEAVALYRAAGDRRNAALCQLNLAACHDGLGRRDEAIPVVREALALAVEMGDRPVEVGALTSLAEWAAARGDHDEARLTCLRAREIAREIGSVRDEAQLLLAEADVERQTGDLDLAAARIDEAALLVGRAGDAYLDVHVHIARGHLVKARGEDGAPHLAAARRAAEDGGLGGYFAGALDALAAALRTDPTSMS
ncbi:MAG: protein kinase [Acidobacteriota bacterium]